jgi:hypothetical protein
VERGLDPVQIIEGVEPSDLLRPDHRH